MVVVMYNKTPRKSWNQEQDRLLDEAADVNAPARILLAEDDDEMRKLLSDALRDEGYAVEEVRDGNELMARVRSAILQWDGRAPVDLVISDIRMPGCSGLDVLRSLRDEDWSVPVILITAFGDEDTHRTAREYGATMVLDKPFEMGDLCAAASFLVLPRPTSAYRPPTAD
jgi:DNA-binding response OmpR family regulator